MSALDVKTGNTNSTAGGGGADDDVDDDNDDNNDKDDDVDDDVMCARQKRQALAAHRPGLRTTFQERPILLSALIVLLGMGVTAAFIALGVKGAQREQYMRLEKLGSDVAKAVQSTWNYYNMAALWIHDSCRSTADHAFYYNNNASFPICSRADFRSLYEYLLADGLEFQSISFVPNVTHDYRAQLEAESRAYYQKYYPAVNYTGFMGLLTDPSNPRVVYFRQREEQNFYLPQHLVEPVPGNEYLIDFDVYSSSYSYLLDAALTNWKPSLSAPLPSPNGRYGE